MALFGGEPINPGYTCPDTIPLAVPIERFNPDPDYVPPQSEITYEVEWKDGEVWVKHQFVRGTFTDDHNLAEHTTRYYRAMLFEARMFRVETVRSQIAV